MDTMDTAKGISTIGNGSTGDFHLLRYLVAVLTAIFLRVVRGGGVLRALTEDNGPGFRKKSAPVARSGGYVLVARVRRARTAAVLDTRTPCRARPG